MDKQIGAIYETRDYSIFKHLEGNRTDAVKRGSKIIESIEKNGYVLSPICVNENFEVIDGQGRLYALEQKNLPVHYYIAKGAGIKDCISMNIYGTKWNTKDYIESYAGRGIYAYVKLLDLCERYPMFGVPLIICSITGTYGTSSSSLAVVQKGEIDFNETQYKNAILRLEYCKKAYDALDEKVKGVKQKLYYALMFIFDRCPGNFNRDKLLEKLELYSYLIPPLSDIDSTLKSISEIYNYKSRGQTRMYFDVEYDKYMCANIPSYTTRWSKGKR